MSYHLISMLADMLEERDLTPRDISNAKERLEREVELLKLLIDTKTSIRLDEDEDDYVVSSASKKIARSKGESREDVINKVLIAAAKELI